MTPKQRDRLLRLRREAQRREERYLAAPQGSLRQAQAKTRFEEARQAFIDASSMIGNLSGDVTA